MLFAHISDTHLGYRQYNLSEREEDFYSAFRQAIQKIIGAGCDFVIHSGDLFEEPRPHVRAMVEVQRAIDELHAHGIKFFTVAGNHDILMRKGAMIPHALYKKMEVLTLKRPWREFDGIFISGLPYHSKIYSNVMREELKKLEEIAKEYERRIIILHQGIDKYFGLEYELKVGDVPSGFDYYAMGHVHKRIEDEFGNGKLAYPGSTETWRIDEVQELEKNGKGFFIVDVKDFSVQKVNLKVRPFIKVECNSCDEIKEKIKGMDKPLVHVSVKSDVNEYQKIYRELIRELSGDVLHLDIKRIKEEENRAIFTESIDIKGLIKEAMNNYTEDKVDFAYSIFKLLSSGNFEGALALTQKFYKEWNKPLRIGQSKLEAFG